MAVAVGLVIAGSALLLDPANVADRAWRFALAAVLAALLVCLTMAGYIASRATLKILPSDQPRTEQAAARTALTEVDARWDRALFLLRLCDFNHYFSLFKVTQVKFAGYWYRGALICLGALSILLMVYAAIGPIGTAASAR